MKHLIQLTLLIQLILIPKYSVSQFVGTPYSTPFYIGLDFDGANDAVSLGNITDLNNVSQYTVEYWGRFANFSTWTTMLGKRITDSERVVHVQFGGTSGQVYAFIGSSYIYTTSVIIPNQWTHIAVVYDGTLSATNRLKIYFNGILQPVINIGTIPTLTPSSNAIFSLGSEYNYTTAMSSGNTGFLHCEQTLAQLRIWNTARTQTQITNSMYNFDLSLASTGLLYYYKMDEGIPDGNNTGTTTIIDSKSANNGNLFNFSMINYTSNFITLPY